MVPAEETATATPALEFALDPSDPKQFSHIETDLSLGDIGIAGTSSFTVSFWAAATNYQSNSAAVAIHNGSNSSLLFLFYAYKNYKAFFLAR